MFSIEDGRKQFYQWDSNRRLIVADSAINEVHFSNRTDDSSLVCETFVENGITLVNVPNILLQDSWRIHVYAFDKEYTKHEDSYEVIARAKPADYAYTETEVLNWNTISEKVAIMCLLLILTAILLGKAQHRHFQKYQQQILKVTRVMLVKIMF